MDKIVEHNFPQFLHSIYTDGPHFSHTVEYISFFQWKLTDMLINWQIQWKWLAMFKQLPGIGMQFKAYYNESTLRFWSGKRAMNSRGS